MIMGNSLYFAVDEGTRKKYEQAGMRPFSYMTKKGRVQVRKYFELPEDVLTDPEQLRLWAAVPMLTLISLPYVSCWFVSVLTNGLRVVIIFSFETE